RFTVEEVSVIVPAFCQEPERLSVLPETVIAPVFCQEPERPTVPPELAEMPPALPCRLVIDSVPPLACREAEPPPGPLLVTEEPMMLMVWAALAVTVPLTVRGWAALPRVAPASAGAPPATTLMPAASVSGPALLSSTSTWARGELGLAAVPEKTTWPVPPGTTPRGCVPAPASSSRAAWAV